MAVRREKRGEVKANREMIAHWITRYHVYMMVSYTHDGSLSLRGFAIIPYN